MCIGCALGTLRIVATTRSTADNAATAITYGLWSFDPTDLWRIYDLVKSVSNYAVFHGCKKRTYSTVTLALPDQHPSLPHSMWGDCTYAAQYGNDLGIVYLLTFVTVHHLGSFRSMLRLIYSVPHSLATAPTNSSATSFPYLLTWPDTLDRYRLACSDSAAQSAVKQSSGQPVGLSNVKYAEH